MSTTVPARPGRLSTLLARTLAVLLAAAALPALAVPTSQADPGAPRVTHHATSRSGRHWGIGGGLAVTRRLAPPPVPLAPAPTPTPTPAPTPTPTQSAAAPLGANQLVFDSDRTGNFEIYVMDTDGTNVVALTADPSYDSWWPRLSPDRRTVLFYRTPKGVHDSDYGQTSLWSIGADGSNLVDLRPAGTDGWRLQGHVEWSPDGTHLVMFGGRANNPQIFVTDALGRQPRAVTARGGVNVDPSYSPDGSTIAFVGCPNASCQPTDQEIYTIGVNGGAAVRLSNDGLRDQDPYYSPDGTRLAWLTNISAQPVVWDITVCASDGTSCHLLMNDNGVTSRPQWSADGRTLYFHRLSPDTHCFEIYSAAPDGSNLTDLTLGQPGQNEYPGL